MATGMLPTWKPSNSTVHHPIREMRGGMADDSERAERRTLLDRLERGEGTIDEAEHWVTRLKELDPLFYGSDYMLGLERGVRARRIYDQLVAELGGTPTKRQLVDIVAKVQRGEGTEEQVHAWLWL